EVEERSTQGDSTNLFDHDDAVWSVDWSSTGLQIASGSIDGTVRIWDAASGNQLQVITTGVTSTVAWSPDGTKLAYNTASGAITIIPAPDIPTPTPAFTATLSAPTATQMPTSTANYLP
ncbi:MAG: hypothetical protein H7Y11_10440, partial [Armatimonadetes bacterium]|nr:hypothetical protein [Anaerolineae bacterium]